MYVEKPPATSRVEVSAAEILFPSGNTKTILMTEIPLIQLNSLSPEEIEKEYDLVVACFEHPNYLKRFLNENFQYLPKFVPKIGVHCKSDRVDFEVYMSREDEKEVNQYGIKKIVQCSAKNSDVRDFLSTVEQAIGNP